MVDLSEFNNKVIEADVVVKSVRRTRHFYDAMLRNSWHMPSFKSSIVTQEWMQDVRFGKLWCPKVQELQIRNCPDPPTMDQLLRDFQQQLLLSKKDVGLDIEDHHVPDKRWILNVISTLNPGHFLFKKDYVPPKKESEAVQTHYVPNGDDFFTGIPEMYKEKDKRSKGKAYLTPEQKLQLQWERMHKAQEKKERRMEALAKKIQAAKLPKVKTKTVRIPVDELDDYKTWSKRQKQDLQAARDQRQYEQQQENARLAGLDEEMQEKLRLEQDTTNKMYSGDQLMEGNAFGLDGVQKQWQNMPPNAFQVEREKALEKAFASSAQKIDAEGQKMIRGAATETKKKATRSASKGKLTPTKNK